MEIRHMTCFGDDKCATALSMFLSLGLSFAGILLLFQEVLKDTCSNSRIELLLCDLESSQTAQQMSWDYFTWPL
ncbi:hypothetical protein L1987_26195 [Smallanthus sonchifolius]|uniref:Uncharacterized protein n=1 Tax=Smallanthus sonchifolius TaxID=185202 RepID=A0ACB9IB17_9ASTR|nr:hypothetical protein L1987_26195 [Smallanthus sonchifolius]